MVSNIRDTHGKELRMRYAWIAAAALVLGLLPSVASADHRRGSYGFSFGYNSGAYHRGSSYGFSFGYNSGYRYGGYRGSYGHRYHYRPSYAYIRPTYYPPRVVIHRPVYIERPVYYAPPPVVV
jgi:hypothetical protein